MKLLNIASVVTAMFGSQCLPIFFCSCALIFLNRFEHEIPLTLTIDQRVFEGKLEVTKSTER
jgi:hypothetical protein